MTHMPTYRYLRLERDWPTLEGVGVEVGEDGAVTLARLPALAEPLGDLLPPLPGLDGPAGIGVHPCGDVYVSDLVRHRVIRIDACDDSATPLPCLTGPGSEPGQLLAPRGLLVGPRDALYIADSGNRRVVIVDLATGQLRGIWGGEEDPVHAFVQPWDLAADSRGAIYVADPGAMNRDGQWASGRLWKLDVSGRVDGAFDARLRAQPEVPGAPASVAIALLDARDASSERLIVLDRRPPRLLAYMLDGTLDTETTLRWSRALGGDTRPTSVALTSRTLYVSDAAGRRVLVFGVDGAFRGVARTPNANSLGLGVDCRGRLIVHPGSGDTVRRALGLPVFAECGTLLLGPYEAQSEPTRWQRLQLIAEPIPEGAHLRLFTLTSDTLDGTAGRRPVMPVVCDGTTGTSLVAESEWPPAPRDRWRVAARDATDVLALNAPARFLWIAAQLQSDGNATPALRQLHLTHDEDGWIQFLPALYRRDETSRVFLERALAAFESVLDEDESLIDALARHFDAFAVPDVGDRPTWLDWLADWVDAGLSETWDDATRRDVTADAFRMHARRGTIESLRRLVRLYTGATPFIEESFVPGLWSLGASGRLGVSTMLADASPDGAVLGATARVNRSSLIHEEDRGAPVFDERAHRFTVRVYAAELSGTDGLDRVRGVIDREKPAHTTYHLCAIEARARAGAQARLGIDAIVAGPPLATSLGGSARLGNDMALGDTPGGKHVGSALGKGARVGIQATVR